MADDSTRRSRDRLLDISIKLDQSHLVYLQTDESPLKLQQRQKLEGFIKEYLCLVPNDNKYEFQETADILHRSAATVQDFSGYRACNAWNAIALYAANLLAQPWRKEYKNLKTYSGYYKHEVDANLIGAELTFELMGYRHAGLGELILEGPIDPDKVSNVSRDAIVAFVECQILKQIWESVSQNFSVSWLEVLEFRENHVGTPEQAIRALNYRFLEKMHRNRVKTTTYRDYRQPPANTTDLISTAPYNFPVNNYNAFTNPYQTGYKYFGDTNIPPPIQNLQYFQPVDYNSGNRCNIYGHQKVDGKYFGGVNANDYCAPIPSYPGRVPTGQLIELDTPTPVINYQKKDNKRILNTISHYTPDFDEADCSKGQIGDVNNYEYAKVEKKASKPGLGGSEKNSFSSWDFVYRNLESLGYSKDLGDREDVLHKRESDLYRIRQQPFKDPLNHQEERYAQSYLDKRKVHSNFEGLDRLATNGRGVDESFLPKKKSSCDDLNKELRDRTYQDRSNIIDRDKKYSQTLPNQHKHRVVEIDQIAKVSDSMRNLDLRQNDTKNEKQIRWQCSTCTFLNTVAKDICEMCGKSKRRGNEDKPLASGGKECPQCTLVNEKNAANCDACGASLKDSPTYI